MFHEYLTSYSKSEGERLGQGWPYGPKGVHKKIFQTLRSVSKGGGGGVWRLEVRCVRVFLEHVSKPPMIVISLKIAQFQKKQRIFWTTINFLKCLKKKIDGFPQSKKISNDDWNPSVYGQVAKISSFMIIRLDLAEKTYSLVESGESGWSFL